MKFGLVWDHWMLVQTEPPPPVDVTVVGAATGGGVICEKGGAAPVEEHGPKLAIDVWPWQAAWHPLM
jgi:hypothetical protein